MSKQPEALRLADAIDLGQQRSAIDCINAAAELRRLHALNQELLEGVIDVQPIGYHSLQLIFKSQADIAKFKDAYQIGVKK